MLEIHILRSRPAGRVLSDCLSSAAKTGAGIRVIDNVGRSIAYGREKAYSECESEYVSFLDDDDLSLLTPPVAKRLCGLDLPAVFTNGVVTFRGDKTCKVLPTVKAWTLDLERRRMCRPHPTIIYKADFARDLVRESLDLMRSMGWAENTFDYVMRAVVSNTIGWHYDPAITYQWNIGADSYHQVHSEQFAVLRNYFFG